MGKIISEIIQIFHVREFLHFFETLPKVYAYSSLLLSIIFFAITKLPNLTKHQRNGLITLVALAVGFSFFALSADTLDAFLTNQSRAIYNFRVIALGPDKSPYPEELEITSTVGEKLSMPTGCLFRIPASDVPTDGKVTFYAKAKNAFIAGNGEAKFSEGFNQTIYIQMKHHNNAHVLGIVVDKAGKPIASADVSIVGFGQEGILTTRNGSFDLPAHKADGQQVQLRVDKSGYRGICQWTLAGPNPTTVVLEH